MKKTIIAFAVAATAMTATAPAFATDVTRSSTGSAWGGFWMEYRDARRSGATDNYWDGYNRGRHVANYDLGNRVGRAADRTGVAHTINRGMSHNVEATIAFIGSLNAAKTAAEANLAAAQRSLAVAIAERDAFAQTTGMANVALTLSGVGITLGSADAATVQQIMDSLSAYQTADNAAVAAAAHAAGAASRDAEVATLNSRIAALATDVNLARAQRDAVQRDYADLYNQRAVTEGAFGSEGVATYRGDSQAALVSALQAYKASDNAAAIAAARAAALAAGPGSVSVTHGSNYVDPTTTNSTGSGTQFRTAAAIAAVSGGLIVGPDGMIHDSVTLADGRTFSNFANISDADTDALEAAGYNTSSFAVRDAITGAIESAIDGAYENGYEDGYKDGYADGFADGVASVQ